MQEGINLLVSISMIATICFVSVVVVVFLIVWITGIRADPEEAEEYNRGEK